VGIGEKYVYGEPTGQIGLKAPVTRKLHLSQLDPDWLIPSTFDGFLTDVDRVFILSNNHALARCNWAQLGKRYCNPGDWAGGRRGRIL